MAILAEPSKIIHVAASMLLLLAAGWTEQPSRPAEPTEAAYAQFPAWMKQKRWKEMAAAAGELHRSRPQDPAALYWLGIAQIELHHPVGALQALREAQKLGLDTAVAHESLALAYYDLNQFLLFEEQMARATQLDPKDFRPHYYLGLYRWSIRSDPSGALEHFERAAQLEPDDWKTLYQQGNCLEELGQLRQAQDRYRKAIALVERQKEPFGWPYQGMSRLLLDEDPASALSFAKRAVELQPEEASNHLILAKAHQRTGGLTDAIREARLAAEKNPTDSGTLYTLYKFLRQAGSAEAASVLKRFEEVRSLYDAD